MTHDTPTSEMLKVEADAELEQNVAGAASREVAEIQSALVMARKIPRDELKSFAALMRSCKRPAFAQEVTYAYPRGGETISGPSIYLAREAARVWGNIRHGVHVNRDTPTQRTIRAWAWDLETNTKVEAEDTFEKLVYRKKGGWIKPDERDLRELSNRRGAILKRNCILEVLPKDLVEDAMATAQGTLENETARDPAQMQKSVAVGFSEINITPEQLTELLGHPLSQCSPAELVKLRGIYKSIADGHTTWGDHVGQPEATPPGSRRLETDPAPPATAEAAPDPIPATQSPPEALDQPDAQPATPGAAEIKIRDVISAISHAKTADDLDGVLDLTNGLPEGDKLLTRKMIADKRKRVAK